MLVLLRPSFSEIVDSACLTVGSNRNAMGVGLTEVMFVLRFPNAIHLNCQYQAKR